MRTQHTNSIVRLKVLLLFSLLLQLLILIHAASYCSSYPQWLFLVLWPCPFSNEAAAAGGVVVVFVSLVVLAAAAAGAAVIIAPFVSFVAVVVAVCIVWLR
jgi:hypothetical protein